MNVNFTYTDRFTVTANDPTTLERVEWTSVEAIPLEFALTKVREYFGWGFATATVTSATTGELIAEAERDEDDDSFENAEDDDFDFEDDVDECGYNPYMGCYDYDC